jgi:hypothetical protein
MREVRTGVVLFAAVIVLSTCGNARATLDEWAIAAKAGTLGLGGDLTTNLIPLVNLRAGVQWLGFSFDKEFGDTEYNVDLDLLHPLILVDWHPFSGAFRVSGGLLFTGGDMRLRATPTESVEVGGVLYTAEEVGRLRADVDFRPVAPYIGIGWGNSLDRKGRWGLATDLGVAFTGSPDVDLSATGPIATDPTFQARLAEEERDIQDDLDVFRIYPVLSISLFYRF